MEKKFNINDYGYVLGIFALAVCLVTFTYSCKTPSLAETRYVPYYLHDTVTVKPPPLSDAERQNALDKFYKYGYDKYYGPQFEKLQAIINLQAISNGKQAATIKALSDYMAQTRHRSDSIARERNYYRGEWLKYQQQALKSQKRTDEYQRQVIALLNEHNAQNEKDIKINFVLAVTCLIGVVFLVILWIGLYITVKRLIKKTSHA